MIIIVVVVVIMIIMIIIIMIIIIIAHSSPSKTACRWSEDSDTRLALAGVSVASGVC